MSDFTGRAPDDGHSTAALIQQASEQFSRLVRAEAQLAKAELTDKGRRAGRGAAVLAGAAVTGLLGAGALVASIVLALALHMPAWAAALVTAAALLAVAALAALVGVRKVRQAMPPLPQETIDSVKSDVGSIGAHAAERNR